MTSIPAIVVMGVSGCGKTSVASAIAERTHGKLIEGDAYHPPANVQKMSEGHPLTDEDRAGWLDLLSKLLAEDVAAGRKPVLACSALKKSYRDILRRGVPSLGFVFLDLSRDAAADRVSHRPGHFMPASLIDSQFATLERPEHEAKVFTIDATRPIAEIAGRSIEWWQAPTHPAAEASLS